MYRSFDCTFIFFDIDIPTEYVSSEFFLVMDEVSHQLYQISSRDMHVSTAQLQEAARPDLAIFNSGTGEIIWFDSHAAAIKLSFLNGTSVRLVKSMHGNRYVSVCLCVSGLLVFLSQCMYFSQSVCLRSSYKSAAYFYQSFCMLCLVTPSNVLIEAICSCGLLIVQVFLFAC